ncbi:hypothetical protein EMIT036CA2_50317 [Chryseobacterium sp. IT-36CA2]
MISLLIAGFLIHDMKKDFNIILHIYPLFSNRETTFTSTEAEEKGLIIMQQYQS